MSHSCFFYGTLLHPLVIKRVLQNDANHLSLCPAILYDHTRHHVKNADYPGVVPYSESRRFSDRELSRDERCVRGSLVTGINEDDMKKLDFFEGEMYERRNVEVHPLSSFISLASSSTHYDQFLKLAELPQKLPDPVAAETYIWTAKLEWLDPGLWDYETFVNEKLHRWIGGKGWEALYEDEYYQGPEEESQTSEPKGERNTGDGPSVNGARTADGPWMHDKESQIDIITQRMSRAQQESKPSNTGF